MTEKICVLGSGAWGTALSCCLSKNKNKVVIWGINENEINDINNGYNKKYFGDKKLFARFEATLDLNAALKDARYILIAVPSNVIISVIKELKLVLNKNTPLTFINVAKGLDSNTDDVWSKSIKKELKRFDFDLVSLVGPSFAVDVFDQKPTVVNVSSKRLEVSRRVSELFNSNFFKAIPIADEIGVQVLSALKNLLAIGVGIAQENHNSINTISAMLTEGIMEMQVIAKKMGSKSKTILQFCGIGDIFLTCTSDKSRNFTFGKEIFRNGLQKTIKNNKTTVEGYKVYKIVSQILNKYKLDTPVFKLIIKVLDGKLAPQDFVNASLEDILKNSKKQN